MTNIAAYLLALTLTGAPVAGVICIADCRQVPVTSGHCHENVVATEEPAMSAGSSCADPFVGQTVYVIEHRALASAAVLTDSSSVTTLAVVETTAPSLLPRSAARG